MNDSLLLRITYLKTESPHLVGRATPVLSLSKRPDAAGFARPTVNHLTVMNYVKLNSNYQFAGCSASVACAMRTTQQHEGVCHAIEFNRLHGGRAHSARYAFSSPCGLNCDFKNE